jgi:succinoglycan biosynthesis protein ExoM
VESEPGISAARNRCLAEALVFEPDLLAFVDDDEVALAGWLEHHCSALERFGADASFGPVPPEYDPDVPGWVRRLGFFEVPRHETGSAVHYPATGNVLFRAGLLDRLGGALFDRSYGLTGSEDIEFFERARAAGAAFVWCDEAVATEHVPRDRANAGWLWRRWRRIGMGVARDMLRRGTPRRSVAWWGISNTARNLLRLARATPAGLDTWPPLGHRITQVVQGVGTVEGSWGRRILEYERVRVPSAGESGR